MTTISAGLAGERRAYSVSQFCAEHGISRGTFYALKKLGLAPREMRVLRRVLISSEAAAEWRERMSTRDAPEADGATDAEAAQRRQ